MNDRSGSRLCKNSGRKSFAQQLTKEILIHAFAFAESIVAPTMLRVCASKIVFTQPGSKAEVNGGRENVRFRR